MATRRRSRGAKIAQGVGAGLEDFLGYLLRQRLNEQSSNRILERQLAVQDQGFENQVLQDLIAGLGKEEGGMDESQAGTIWSTMRPGRPAPDFAGMRPPVRRRLQAGLGKQIDTAASPEAVPDVEAILSAARGQGLERYEGPPATEDPFEMEAPVVQEFGRRAGARRRSLMEKPTETLTGTDPATGAPFTQRVSPYDLITPRTTGPTASQRGTLEGQQELAKLEAGPTPEYLGSRAASQERALLEGVGPARAAQSGLEAGAAAQARANVETSPQVVNAEIRKRTAIAAAEMQARFPYELRLATERANIEVRQKLSAEHAQLVKESSDAATALQPFLMKVIGLTDRLNTEDSGPMARGFGLMEKGAAMLGMSPDVRELQQLIAQNARKIAVASGVREANVSERETSMIMDGIGLDPGNTRQENGNALRNLYDLITISPVVAARLPYDATFDERWALSQQLMQQRRAAEAAAIKAWPSLTPAQRQRLKRPVYRDPVTNRPMIALGVFE